MNPYAVDCEDCGPIKTDCGLEAALAHAMEHTLENPDHTCQIATDEEIVLEGALAEGNA